MRKQHPKINRGGDESVINNVTNNAEKTNSSEGENESGISTQADTSVEHGLVITGGTEGTDYTYENGVVTIKTSTSLTFTNKDKDTATTDRIIVPEGVSADVTFAGVNIAPTENSPFTLTPSADGNGAKAHITLADGTVNTLTAKQNGYPGLRSGKTTTLTIDDSVLNIDNKGKEITPELGVIPYDVTLLNGTSLKKGDRLTLMDSEEPGELIAYAAYNAAAIGGGGGEDGGTMTFNGGKITAQGIDSQTYSDFYSGAGIGGGLRGSGGNIIINGGDITANGSYHGAGVGGGYGYYYPPTPTMNPKAVDSELHRGHSGNITINGGYTKSNGGVHGNGFGEGCSMVDSNAENYKIIVTGGTVLAKAGDGKGVDLGGSLADVYVLGGSLRANTFQGKKNINYAYGDMNGDTQVFMTKINLASLGAGAKNALVEGMDMRLAGVDYPYGMPSYTDDKGILYFWLPNSNKGNELSVDLDIINKETGKRLDTDTFFITKADAGSFLKQYINFEIPKGTLSQDSIKKHYDGTTGFNSDEIKKAVAALKIQTPLPTGGVLDDEKFLTIQAQRLKDDGVTVEDNAEIVDVDQGLVGGGKYQLIITSTQYAKSDIDNFNEAYWGHRTYFKYAEIEPADTQIALDIKNKVDNTDYVRPDRTMTFKASVSPASNEATTCASPKGKVQFYINGKPYGDPVDLEVQTEVNNEGYHYSTASITWNAADGSYCKPGETAEVTVKYIGNDSNYTNGCEAKDKLNIAEYNPVITGKTGHALTFDGVPNMKYDVTTKDGTKVGEVTTDENGKAVVKGLDKNTEYTITNKDFGTTTGKTLPEDAEDIANRFREDEEDKAKVTGEGLDEKASNSKVDVVVDDDGNYKVILKDDINGTVTIPDNWGDVTVDLNGNTIKGNDATDKEPAKPGLDFVKDDTSKGNGTNLVIKDTSKEGTGTIAGGNGSSKYPDGAAGIKGDKEAATPTVDVEKPVKVIGGNGATGEDGNGGNGGSGIEGNIDTIINGGTVIGGDGGNGADRKDENGGTGGNGGTGIKTDDQPVKVETGKVSGGNGGAGGSSETKDGGEAGEGGKTIDAGKADSTTNKDAEITEGNKGEKGKDKTSEVKEDPKEPTKDEEKQNPTEEDKKDQKEETDGKDKQQGTTAETDKTNNTDNINKTTPQETVESKKEEPKKTSKVKTGDETPIVLYGAFAVISVLGILFLKKKVHD